MGRWAQSRRRGNSAPQIAPAAIAAPTPEQWTFNNDGESEAIAVILSGLCPLGADGFQLAAAVDPFDSPDDALHQTAACGASAVIAVGGLGDTLNGWIRWMSGVTPVSDWSAMKQTTIPP